MGRLYGRRGLSPVVFPFQLAQCPQALFFIGFDRSWDWKPVWVALEGQWRLHLAQARPNCGPRGRKTDFRDAKRIVSRLLSGDLILSYVPEPEQRGWRTLTWARYQLRQDRVRLQNQLESLLEEVQIKLSSMLSDLLGKSGRRILQP